MVDAHFFHYFNLRTQRLLGPVALVLAGAATACARLPGPPRPSSRHGNVLVARKVWGFSDEKEEVTTTTSTTTTDATTTTTGME